MKNILLLFVLLSSIFASCSKESKMSPKEDGSGFSDPIKNQYSGLIPELKLFNNLKEELNSTEDYIVVVGSLKNKILVAYISKKSKQLVFKSIFEVPKEIKGDFLVSEIKASPAQLKNDAVSLILGWYDGKNNSEGMLTELGNCIIYLNSNELKHITIPYPQGIKKELLDMDFTFKTISFTLRDSLFLFDRSSAKELLATRETAASLMVHPLAKIFLEGNKMVWVEFLPNDKEKCVVRCFPLSQKDGQYFEIWSRIIPLNEAKNTDAVTYQFFLTDDENDVILNYKAFAINEDAPSENLNDFSEEHLYTFDKITGM